MGHRTGCCSPEDRCKQLFLPRQWRPPARVLAKAIATHDKDLLLHLPSAFQRRSVLVCELAHGFQLPEHQLQIRGSQSR